MFEINNPHIIVFLIQLCKNFCSCHLIWAAKINQTPSLCQKLGKI
ncbi:hypothetical protein LPE509_03095 [Legionella pneumophila subsp. pneumophila LPE509]|nr:hypothetical protein LPE509_03095 [Legionella pneumophila subsp. pneumophila LPE509]